MITVADAKQYLRIDHDAENVEIDALLNRARAIVYDYLGHDQVIRLQMPEYAWPKTKQFGWPAYPALYPEEGADPNATTEVPNSFGEMLGYSYDVIDAATLLVLGELYANRDSSADPLSPAVRALLERQRSPAIA